MKKWLNQNRGRNLQVSNDVLIPQIKGHDGDDVRFVLDHHLSMIFYSASLLKQQ
jgi:hypothetical protein